MTKLLDALKEITDIHLPQYFITYVVIALALIGLIFVTTTTSRAAIEGFLGLETDIPEKCPNLLVKKDKYFYLYNTLKAEVPGVNPIRFDSLEEYVNFTEWMKAKGVRCPVLYAQQMYDTQGQRTYKMIPDAADKQEGGRASSADHIQRKLIDAGHDKGSYPGFDPENQDIGVYTPLDKMFNAPDTKGSKASWNPMDPNWGGIRTSQAEAEAEAPSAGVSVWVEKN
jgi:hypothetical protein